MSKRYKKIIMLFMVSAMCTSSVTAYASDSDTQETDAEEIIVENVKQSESSKSVTENNSESLENKNYVAQTAVESQKDKEEDDKSTSEVTIGIKENSDKTKILIDGKGNIVKSSWCKVGGSWYYFDDNGFMKNGWVKSNDKWYHTKTNGVLENGWIKDNGSWYYCNQSGEMQTGWIELYGSWYYLKSSGEMVTGWQFINGKWYYFNVDGVMLKNTIVQGYALGNDGSMK